MRLEMGMSRVIDSTTEIAKTAVVLVRYVHGTIGSAEKISSGSRAASRCL